MTVPEWEQDARDAEAEWAKQQAEQEAAREEWADGVIAYHNPYRAAIRALEEIRAWAEALIADYNDPDDGPPPDELIAIRQTARTEIDADELRTKVAKLIQD